MKKVLAVVLLASLCACTGSLPSKFERLATKVEREGERMSDSQWEKCNNRFELLLDRYGKTAGDLTLSENAAVWKSFERYLGSLLEYAPESLADEIAGLFDDYSDEFDGFLDNCSDSFARLIDEYDSEFDHILDGYEERLDRFVDEHGDDIDNLMDDISDSVDELAGDLGDIVDDAADLLDKLLN